MKNRAMNEAKFDSMAVLFEDGSLRPLRASAGSMRIVSFLIQLPSHIRVDR